MEKVAVFKKSKAKCVAYVALFALLLAVCAWIAVPAAVPFTMQTFAVFLAVAVLGGKMAFCAVGCYLCIGFVGLPVFASGGAGFSVLFSATGGYMLGWLLLCLVAWLAQAIWGDKRWVLIASLAVGLLMDYAVGTLWFYYIYIAGTSVAGLVGAATVCVLPYILPDLIKLCVALWLAERLKRALHKNRNA